MQHCVRIILTTFYHMHHYRYVATGDMVKSFILAIINNSRNYNIIIIIFVQDEIGDLADYTKTTDNEMTDKGIHVHCIICKYQNMHVLVNILMLQIRIIV